jgi:hypothetical protein
MPTQSGFAGVRLVMAAAFVVFEPPTDRLRSRPANRE